MKKIAMILLPLQVCPGESSVSTLLKILADENEIYQKSNITIFSRYDKTAKEKSKSYQKTKFQYIKYNKFDEFLLFIYRIIKKVFKVRIFFLDRYYYKCYKICKKEKFDNIIVEAGQYDSYRNYTKEFGKEKMVLHLHQEEYKKKYDEIFGKIICVSNYLKQHVMKNSDNIKKNILVLKNGIDLKNFNINVTNKEKKNLRKKLNIKEQDFVIIFCGRLFNGKGILELIECINKIQNKNIKLLIVGDLNNKKDKFKQLLNNKIHQNPEQFIITGYVKNDEIYRYYKISDLQVIPSICEEAAGLVAIEGMICGLPIIATKSGGMIEYIDETCATIVDKDNKLVSNLEKAILELYNDKEKCKIMGRNGKKRAKQFNEKKYYTDFVNLIERLGK